MDNQESVNEEDDILIHSEFESTEHAEDDQVNVDKNSPIYHGHHMTVYTTSMILILLYSVCHTISGAQLSDLLTNICLIVYICILDLKVFLHLSNVFADLHSLMVKHYYCVR